MMSLIALLVTVWLPFVGGWNPDPGPTFVIAGVTREASAASACFDSMAPLAAAGMICPTNGQFLALLNSDRLALGGRQGDGTDAAWSGAPADLTLIPPERVIVDPDVLEIRVAGYVESPGLYTASDTRYSLIVLSGDGGAYTVAAANETQARPPWWDRADFQQEMGQMLKEGQVLDVDWPADFRFWNRTRTLTFSPAQCGASHAAWFPDELKTIAIGSLMSGHLMVGGIFDPNNLDSCMGDFRWVDIGNLMQHPAAKRLQDQVNARRGGQTTTFSWYTDARARAYAFWSMASGTLAYYGWRILNAGPGAPSPATFIYIPEQFLDVTCSIQAGQQVCLVTPGQPEQ